MPFSKRYIVQLDFELWLAPWHGDPGRTMVIENAKWFTSRRQAEKALEDARKYWPFPDAFVDVQRVTVI